MLLSFWALESFVTLPISTVVLPIPATCPSAYCTYLYQGQKTQNMFKNYLKVAVRSLFKNKFYSLLNISGLAIGVAACLMITLFVLDEVSYDKYYKKADRIYRMKANGALNGNTFDIAVVGPSVGEAMLADLPQIENYGRFRQNGSPFIRQGDNVFKEEKFIWADNSILDIFDFEMVEGNRETALAEPRSLVMSQSAAQKYFGDETALGQVVKFRSTDGYKVTGVYKDIPSNTHFNFDVLGSIVTIDEANQKMWLSMNFQTYLVLKEGASIDEVRAAMPGMMKKYIGPEVKQFLQVDWEDLETTGNDFAMDFQPVSDIHLYSDLQAELAPNSDVKYVYIFSAIALFILLIACINFMNLSTARSAHRAKEVGVRKVLGSVKRQLVNQFLAESIVISLISFVLAVGLSYLALPFFNNLANKALEIPFADPLFYASLIGAIVLIGLLAGSYPAFFLSAFKPVKVLKGSINSGMKSGKLRSALVVVQFCASIFLIIGTVIILQQLRYIQNKKLGFDKEQVIVVHDAYLAGNNAQVLKTRMESYPEVESASMSGFIPTPSNRNNNAFIKGMVPSQENTLLMGQWYVDHEYFETMGMEIIAGRAFSKDFVTDSTACIINESAAKQIGWEDPIGETIGQFVDMQGSLRPLKVIGVVQDFHFESLRNHITPLLLQLGNSTGLLNIKAQSDDYASLLSKIEKDWNELAPNQPFETSFLDERFSRIYDAEQRTGNIFGVFAGLALLIACLGLFGLAAFTAENRMKEVGIRKVLGASVLQIVYMLSNQMGKLVLLAFFIAAPLAYLFMDDWLQDFEYRTSIGLWVFLVTAIGALFIAVATMSYQSLKAAVSNPVKSLRSE